MSPRLFWTPLSIEMAHHPVVLVCDEDSTGLRLTCDAIRMRGWIVQPFASAQTLIDYELSDAPTCLILETRFECVHGLDVQRHFLSRQRRPQIVFLTECCDVSTVVQAMHAGAADYLTKPAGAMKLQHAVERALDLDRCRHRDVQAGEAILRKVRTLTRRERQVMAGVAAGRLNKQIAYELTISEVTVKMHRGQVMRKMGVRSVAELVTMLDRVSAEWQRDDPADVSAPLRRTQALPANLASP